MTRPRCATCRWWGTADGTHMPRWAGGRMHCRIKAPTASDIDFVGFWPLTAADDWCGEHAHAPSGPTPTPGEAQARNDGVIAERERILEMMRGWSTRPCDCVYCTCGDTRKAQKVAMWDARVAWANTIAHAPAPEEPADG